MIFFFKLYSDILMNNSTQKYCQEMVQAGHTVYLYNMNYFNPESFGLFTLRMPFLGIILIIVKLLSGYTLPRFTLFNG